MSAGGGFPQGSKHRLRRAVTFTSCKIKNCYGHNPQRLVSFTSAASAAGPLRPPRQLNELVIRALKAVRFTAHWVILHFGGEEGLIAVDYFRQLVVTSRNKLGMIILPRRL